MLIMENRTTDGFSDEITNFGGSVQIQVAGTFDGASVTMQISQDGLAFVNLDELPATYTAPDVVIFTLLQGAVYRLSVINSGASTDVSASSI